MIAVQLLTSAWSWFSSCAQSNVKDPKGSSGNSSTDLKFKNLFSFTSLGNEVVEEKAITASTVLFGSAVMECARFALGFFSLQFKEDSTLITDEKRWPEIFEKIEHIVNAGLEEILECSLEIGMGYYVKAGQSLNEGSKVRSHLPFLEVSEKVNPTIYTEILCEVFPKRTENFGKVSNFNRNFEKLRASSIKLCWVPDPATQMVRDKIEKIKLEVFMRYIEMFG